MTTDTPSPVTHATTVSDAHLHQHSPLEYKDRERQFLQCLANIVVCAIELRGLELTERPV